MRRLFASTRTNNAPSVIRGKGQQGVSIAQQLVRRELANMRPGARSGSWLSPP
jgi:hypothetical protein